MYRIFSHNLIISSTSSSPLPFAVFRPTPYMTKLDATHLSISSPHYPPAIQTLILDPRTRHLSQKRKKGGLAHNKRTINACHLPQPLSLVVHHNAGWNAFVIQRMCQSCMRLSGLFSPPLRWHPISEPSFHCLPQGELWKYSHEQGGYKDSLAICFSKYSKRAIWVPAPASAHALPTSKHDGSQASLLARLLACVNCLLRFYRSFNRVRPRMHSWVIGEGAKGWNDEKSRESSILRAMVRIRCRMNASITCFSLQCHTSIILCKLATQRIERLPESNVYPSEYAALLCSIFRSIVKEQYGAQEASQSCCTHPSIQASKHPSTPHKREKKKGKEKKHGTAYQTHQKSMPYLTRTFSIFHSTNRT